VGREIEIVFETHSTTIDNEHGIATGWLEGELSSLGRARAQELGARRRDDGLAAVFTSDLRRAVETAEIAFAGSDLPVHEDARLRECNYGELNGRPVAEVDALRATRIDDPFPAGESYRQVVARVRSFLRDLSPTFDGKRVLLIGHSATRWSLAHLLQGEPLSSLIEAPPSWQEGWLYALAGEESAQG
jgi:broad specificity phosphatase PhoE